MKPCPFCGKESFLLGVDNPTFKLCRVICLNDLCHATGRSWNTRAEAIAAWNRRAPHADQSKAAPGEGTR